MSKKKKKKESWKERRRRAAIKHQKALEAERLKREREPKKSKGWSKGKIFGVAFMFLLIIGIYGAWQYTQSPSSNNPNTNKQKAPLFALQDLDGNTVALENLTGKVGILDFFFPQCQYCDVEVVHLEEIYREYGRDEVEILSISVKENTIQDIQEFKTGPNRFSDLEYEITWIIARDTATANVIGKYGISGYPTTVIIDQEGYISPNSPFVGLTDASTLSQEIDYLLGR
jgi:cytochrome oxidase Cu insertion factor (SCO1/SenC/PrrC family)